MVAEDVDPPGAPDAVVTDDDPDDDPVVLAAIAGRAEVLCSKDHHLRADVVAHGVSYGLRVVSDVELAHILR